MHKPFVFGRQTGSIPRRMRGCHCFVIAVAVFLLAGGRSFSWPAWQSNVSKEAPGDFPPPRALHANYVFGWAGITAATADIRFSRISQDRFQLQGVGRTTGFARALWRYDVNLTAVANASTLRPIETTQAETARSKKVTTHLVFSNSGVSRARTEGTGAGTTKTKEFNFPNLYDLHSAMLYLRSQPLTEKSVHRVVVYPATSAYLATATVAGRERISTRAGSYNAIKLDLQLKRVGKDLDLQPHRKFRRGTIWVSDDPDRLILRIEAQIFVGTIFAELYSVYFNDVKP
ncbi:MAG: hypothetical protein JWO45_1085 [Spartobacteria bacterium]|nr:hypothetical protein [Spartobacteria bacterium]